MSDTPAIADEIRALLYADRCAVYKRLIAHALGLTKDPDEAVGLANEAVARVLAGTTYAWDRQKPLVDHLGSVINGLARNWRRRAWRRREKLHPGRDDDPPLDAADPRGAAEDAILDEAAVREEDALAARVMARVARDKIIPRMLELEQDGTHAAAEQAAIIGCTVKEIHRARERLAHHRDAVLREARGQDE